MCKLIRQLMHLYCALLSNSVTLSLISHFLCTVIDYFCVVSCYLNRTFTQNNIYINPRVPWIYSPLHKYWNSKDKIALLAVESRHLQIWLKDEYETQLQNVTFYY